MSDVAIIGAGPAGLMAAEVLSSRGIQVTVYDAMPSVGRKFLLAGIGGMNITHSEALPEFLSRYEPCSPILTECVRRFDNRAVVAVMIQVANERLINLEFVNLKALELAE